MCVRFLILLAVCWSGLALQSAPAAGPLRASPINGRYFFDPAGQPVCLTGSHTWNNLQDIGLPAELSFTAYLDFLERHHHNFIRLWRWELLEWRVSSRDGTARVLKAGPHPWARTGPGEALDGQPKFDLSQYDDAYFQRLRARVAEAGERGIYVSIMLFEGWGLRSSPEAWKAHPFHPENNVNQIDPDANRDGKGLEIYTGDNPAVQSLQDAYVRKVIDTVNSFDNVLYEISNENPLYSTEWQYRLIRYIKGYEATKAKRHPIGMTSDGFGGEEDTERLFKSPADWISPSPDRDDYKASPPASAGTKVIISDTDHLWGIGGSPAWVWKSFLRGLNPIFMDPYQRALLDRGSDEQWDPIRRALGDTRRFAERMNLAWMTPQPEAASTGYCLAQPGLEYLVYQPNSGEEFTVKLGLNHYEYEWFDPAKNTRAATGSRLAASVEQNFKAPFPGEAVLHLKATKLPPPSATPQKTESAR